jgi:adenosine deaminase
LFEDDPLQFHYTREPLIEEYSIAAQVLDKPTNQPTNKQIKKFMTSSRSKL